MPQITSDSPGFVHQQWRSLCLPHCFDRKSVCPRPRPRPECSSRWLRAASQAAGGRLEVTVFWGGGMGGFAGRAFSSRRWTSDSLLPRLDKWLSAVLVFIRYHLGSWGLHVFFRHGRQGNCSGEVIQWLGWSPPEPWGGCGRKQVAAAAWPPLRSRSYQQGEGWQDVLWIIIDLAQTTGHSIETIRY